MTSEIGASTATAAQQAGRTPGGKLGKDEFLKMLVAQMRNQDPLNPMQGDQMAVQLAQFSSLEQLTSINSGLEGLTQVMGGQMMETMREASAMGALGRTVLAAGNQVQLGGQEPPTVTVDVGGVGGSATVRVFDAQGREVGSRAVGALGGGRHTLELGSAAKDLPAGTYTYTVEVAGANGQPVATQSYIRARVDGIRYTAQGPVLTAGGINIPFLNVVEVGTD